LNVAHHIANGLALTIVSEYEPGQSLTYVCTTPVARRFETLAFKCPTYFANLNTKIRSFGRTDALGAIQHGISNVYPLKTWNKQRQSTILLPRDLAATVELNCTVILTVVISYPIILFPQNDRSFEEPADEAIDILCDLLLESNSYTPSDPASKVLKYGHLVLSGSRGH
jgi:hypothetical protein